MIVTYMENNSGGNWWLDEKHYTKLADAGWHVNGNKQASKSFDSIREAISDWEETTGLDSNERGCDCCGEPHYFYAEALCADV